MTEQKSDSLPHSSSRIQVRVADLTGCRWVSEKGQELESINGITKWVKCNHFGQQLLTGATFGIRRSDEASDVSGEASDTMNDACVTVIQVFGTTPPWMLLCRALTGVKARCKFRYPFSPSLVIPLAGNCRTALLLLSPPRFESHIWTPREPF